MKPFRPLTAVEQLAAHLRGEIEAGALAGNLPGVHRLAKELGVSPKTVVAAVAQLGNEGWIAGQGARRCSRIVRSGKVKTTGLRVAILPYEPSDRGVSYMINLQHRLLDAGHHADFTSKTLLDLGRNVRRVAAFVKETEADVWVVISGPLEIIEWFLTEEVPAFALFGRRRELKIAGVGPDKEPTMREVVRRLIGLGHRRIVFMVRGERRLPQPGAVERVFLEELAAHGIATGAYHLPHWEETPAGFLRCLDQLFETTPPTALLLDEAFFLGVAQQHLARRGILSPEQVSLVCQDSDPSFAWHSPPIAHVRWDPDPVVRRVVRWVQNVARGKDDRRQTMTKAEFIEGGTIGPAYES